MNGLQFRPEFPVFFVVMLCASLSFSAIAQVDERFEWPCFHGPDRTNKSTETGLLKAWPEDGPVNVLTITGLGEGYSSVSIAGGKLFTAGTADNQTFVYAYDLDGQLLWKQPNGEAWESARAHARAYTGARSTPTFDEGNLYHVGETGLLTAFDAETGDVRWSLDMREEFEAPMPQYAYSESVLVDGDRLYVNPAGRKAFMVCLDKTTGDVIWANDAISGGAAYHSPIVVDAAGFRQVLSMSAAYLYGVDAETGRLLWQEPMRNARSNNCTNPIFHDGYVFASSGYGWGSMLLRLLPSDNGVTTETVWRSPLMDNHHGGVILHEGYLYGAGQNERGWFCLDFMTGEQLWNERGKGSLTYADGMLYLLEERGTMRLVRATHEHFEEVSSFEVPSGGRGLYWAHPVVCGGRLYVRHADNMYAYDIRER